MASNCNSSASSLPQSTSSSDSQIDFPSIAKSLNFVPIKLDNSNYLFWKAQILATIRAFDLVQFIHKSSSPSKYIPNPDTEAERSDTTILNPEYLTWIRSDQLLLGWLFSTMDKEVLAQVIHYESSGEVWSSLETLYSQQTVAKSFQLKQLKSVKKHSLSTNDYILRIKTIAHALTAIGEPLGDKDLLLAILNGLDHEYDTVVSLITYQMDEINLEKVQYLLLMHEQRLVTNNSAVSSSVNFDDGVNVNVATSISEPSSSYHNQNI